MTLQAPVEPVGDSVDDLQASREDAGAVQRQVQHPTAPRAAAARNRRLQGLAGVARDVWPKVVLAVALLVLVWGVIGLDLRADWRQLDREATRQATNLAGVAEQGISRTIEAIDQRLLFARDAYKRDPVHFSLAFLGAASRYDDGMVMQLAMIGPDGILLDTSLGASQHTDLSDREHFRVHLANADDMLFVSKPVLGRVSQRWSVQFTRKVYDGAGAFSGVLVGSLDPTWLTGFFKSLDVTGSLALVGDDGITRAVAPDLARIGESLAGTPLWSRIQADRGAGFDLAGQDGLEAVGHRRLPHYPLHVVVTIDMAKTLALYRERQRSLCTLGICVTLVVILAGVRLARSRRRLRTSRREMRTAIESIDQGLLMVDGRGRIRVSNRRFGTLFGLPSASLVEGRDDRRLMARLPREGQDLMAAALPRAGEASKVHVGDCTLADGSVLEVRARGLEDGGAICTVTDITARRHAQAEIQHLAEHDLLTGLSNRSLMSANLEKAIVAAKRFKTRFAVLCLDLDRFKPVNDSLGHAAGDALLREVATRMAKLSRGADLVARFGGDEFVVLMPEIAQPSDAAALAESIVREVERPFRFDSHELCITASVGVALFPGDGETVEALLHNADTALYRAKDAGRGAVCFFEAEMEERIRRRAEYEHDLRSGLANNEFSLHFQPLYACEGGKPTSFEALLRWNHPTRGRVSPADFIPVAEECGLILSLGRWALEQACRVAATWAPTCSVAVNVSPVQFKRKDFVEVVQEALRASGLEPHRLELEVTEGVLIEDADSALAAMADLKAIGVRFALDDFGTGYSSLSYLQRFPFDKIKIDKSFVQALGVDDSAKVIVDAILAIGRSLDLRITAEGVETAQQLDFLRRHACDEVQGFLLGRPMPAQALRAGDIERALDAAA